jgi:hypothetical protein
MDGDGQNDPVDIPHLVAMVRSGDGYGLWLLANGR